MLAFVDYTDEAQRAATKAALSEVAAKGETAFKFVIGDAAENEVGRCSLTPG